MEEDYNERIERVDTGFSLEIKMTRGTGTRDQETLKAKDKKETLEEIEAEKENIVKFLREVAKDVREIQPEVEEK